jgi:spermidine synthase
MNFSDIHRRHLAFLRDQPAIIDDEGLRIGEQYVMFFAEADLMRRHAQYLLDGLRQADLLEVGIGLGVFAEQAATLDIGTYVAIEAHPAIAGLAEQRVVPSFNGRARLLIGPWQLITLPAEAHDAIMYDTWPPDGHADDDFASFVEHVALPCLRPNGRFSFFHSGARMNPARAAVLDQYFAHWSAHPYTMPVADIPPHWTKPSRDFLIPIAYKGEG